MSAECQPLICISILEGEVRVLTATKVGGRYTIVAIVNNSIISFIFVPLVASRTCIVLYNYDPVSAFEDLVRTAVNGRQRTPSRRLLIPFLLRSIRPMISLLESIACASSRFQLFSIIFWASASVDLMRDFISYAVLSRSIRMSSSGSDVHSAKIRSSCSIVKYVSDRFRLWSSYINFSRDSGFRTSEIYYAFRGQNFLLTAHRAHRSTGLSTHDAGNNFTSKATRLSTVSSTPRQLSTHQSISAHIRHWKMVMPVHG